MSLMLEDGFTVTLRFHEVRFMENHICSCVKSVTQLKFVSKVLGQMWALLALGWVSQDF